MQRARQCMAKNDDHGNESCLFVSYASTCSERDDERERRARVALKEYKAATTVAQREHDTAVFHSSI
eukprot:EC785199.1.p2 GENE.EC785199.1~~EC785199.1.p2  ORF type:complete len:67 (-),score=2.30 EC785199.1:106-306(-)